MPDLLEQIQTKKEARDKRRGMRNEKLGRADAILQVCLDGERNPTDDEKKSIDGFKAEAKADEDFAVLLDSSIEGLEVRANDRDDDTADLSTRRTEPDTLAARVIKERAEDDPRRGFKNDRDFLDSIRQAGRNPDRVPERLRPLQVKAEQRAVGSDEQSTFSDPYGGFFIPTAFSPDMLKLDPESDPMGAFTTRIPMATTSLNLVYRVDKDRTSSVSGGLTVSRREESQAIVASRMQVARLKLEANSLFGMAYTTEEILQDSPISFAALLAAGFSDEFTSAIIKERINGTGAGEFQGIMNSACKIAITAETDQLGGTIVLENIVNMMARCWRFGDAIWLANQTCIPQLAKLNTAIGTGGQVMWFQNAREGLPAQLMGRPLIFTEYCAALGTTGDLILGNWSQYIEGIYQPLQSAESIHVRFVNHERCFKFWLRNAGHCWWDAALTPVNGDTLSPFVVIATRS